MAMWALRGSERTSSATGRSISSASVAAITRGGEVEPVAVGPGGDPRAGHEVDAQRQRQVGLGHLRGRRLRRAGGFGLGDGEGELVGDAAGHLLADPEVVPLEEHQSDHQLQQHERHQ